MSGVDDKTGSYTHASTTTFNRYSKGSTISLSSLYNSGELVVIPRKDNEFSSIKINIRNNGATFWFNLYFKFHCYKKDGTVTTISRTLSRGSSSTVDIPDDTVFVFLRTHIYSDETWQTIPWTIELVS